MRHLYKTKASAARGLSLWAMAGVLIFGGLFPGGWLLPALGLALLASWLLRWLLPRGLLRVLAAALAVLDIGTLFFAAGLCAWGEASDWAAAPESLADRSALFGGGELLVLAPEGGDELSLAGGVMEEYLSAGSRVTIAFPADGDDQRAREALSAASALGIGADRVLFLGSEAGTEELRGLLSSLRPETVICCLREGEGAYSRLALDFEQAMGAALREDPGWKTRVLLGMASAAWNAPDDYRSGRLSASRVWKSGQTDARYAWSDRLSLPVAGRAVSLLSPDLSSTGIALGRYASRDGGLRAGRLVNADKAFFPRRCDSLLRDAALTASSGDGEVLRDWVLSETGESGRWVPEATDTEPTVSFSFSQPVTVSALSLWDDPDPARNTLRAIVRFDTGESVELSPDPAGRESGGILSQPVTCMGLSLTLTEGEGGDWGPVEFAAYTDPYQQHPFFKLTDMEGNYLYDVLLPEDGTGSYTWTAHDMEPGELSLRSDDGACTLTMEGEGFTLHVPEGRSCTVTALDRDGRVLDSARFTAPAPRLRWIMEHFDLIADGRPAAVWGRCRALSHWLQNALFGELRWL